MSRAQPDTARCWASQRWLAVLATVPRFPRLGLRQAECLMKLGAGPMAAVRSARGGWHAPDSCVGVLIRDGYAAYTPPPEMEAAPQYVITEAGRLLLSWLRSEPGLRRLLPEEAAQGAGGGSET